MMPIALLFRKMKEMLVWIRKAEVNPGEIVGLCELMDEVFTFWIWMVGYLKGI